MLTLHSLSQSLKNKTMNVDNFYEVFKISTLAMLGSILRYLMMLENNNQPFRWLYFTIGIVGAFLLCIVLSDIFPKDMTYRDPFLAFSGFCAHPILAVLEKAVMRRVKAACE